MGGILWNFDGGLDLSAGGQDACGCGFFIGGGGQGGHLLLGRLDHVAHFYIFMRQCTQGRGSYSFAFERYEDAPAQVAQKVIEAAKADAD